MNNFNKIYKKAETFDFHEFLWNQRNTAKFLEENMDFVNTVLRSDKVPENQKNFFWDFLDFYDNLDLIRESLDYIDWSSILCTTRSTPEFEVAIEEFLPYFDKTDWRNLEGKLWNLSFDFIMRYSDHWTYLRENSPVRRLWSGRKRDNTPFTKEQEKWIRSMWKRR